MGLAPRGRGSGPPPGGLAGEGGRLVPSAGPHGGGAAAQPPTRSRYDAGTQNSRALSVARLEGGDTEFCLWGHGEEMPLAAIRTPFAGDHWWYPNRIFWRIRARFGERVETLESGGNRGSDGLPEPGLRMSEQHDRLHVHAPRVFRLGHPAEPSRRDGDGPGGLDQAHR